MKSLPSQQEVFKSMRQTYGGLKAKYEEIILIDRLKKFVKTELKAYTCVRPLWAEKELSDRIAEITLFFAVQEMKIPVTRSWFENGPEVYYWNDARREKKRKELLERFASIEKNVAFRKPKRKSKATAGIFPTGIRRRGKK